MWFWYIKKTRFALQQPSSRTGWPLWPPGGQFLEILIRWCWMNISAALSLLYTVYSFKYSLLYWCATYITHLMNVVWCLKKMQDKKNYQLNGWDEVRKCWINREMCICIVESHVNIVSLHRRISGGVATSLAQCLSSPDLK